MQSDQSKKEKDVKVIETGDDLSSAKQDQPTQVSETANIKIIRNLITLLRAKSDGDDQLQERSAFDDDSDSDKSDKDLASQQL